MPFGQLVIGSPGSGKTTYCWGMYQFLSALSRPVHIVNLDPANHSVPYSCDVSLSELITVKDVMQEEGLGPNGAMIYCLEYLAQNLSWLEDKLDELGPDAYVLFDLPGQVELSTNHPCLRKIVERLGKRDWRLVAVHLVDASHITDPSRYISLLLLSLRAMLTLELPHVNVLSKVDLLSQSLGGSDLAFNLDFYTEVQDLTHLLPLIEKDQGSRRAARFADLNRAICELVDDFGLVGFETLAVEDKRSMFRLLSVIDKAAGYVFVRSGEAIDEEGVPNPSVPKTAASAGALFSVADGGAPTGSGWGDALEVQERWVDHREEWDEWAESRREQEEKEHMEKRIYEEAAKWKREHPEEKGQK